MSSISELGVEINLTRGKIAKYESELESPEYKDERISIRNQIAASTIYLTELCTQRRILLESENKVNRIRSSP